MTQGHEDSVQALPFSNEWTCPKCGHTCFKMDYCNTEDLLRIHCQRCNYVCRMRPLDAETMPRRVYR